MLKRVKELIKKIKAQIKTRGSFPLQRFVMQKPAWEWLWREKINDWHVMSGQSRHTGSWAAWAKRTPLLERDPLSEPGDVYFERGQSRQEAIDRLTASDLIA